ncbi:MAG: asparagine synthase (glutamine-hydrolyzing) [Rhodospirillales bacterium]|nr:asparagine synthase (glutamine-hydrolyzing) [Rhodospirillales bacterium]
MCGIAGIVTTAPGDPRLMEASVRRMTDALLHRGPDGEGVWLGDGVALGHRRLSIIDPAGGAQPMIGESGAVIVFNGEIYNYRELRADLEARGCRFKTESDTEVLLAGFEVFGEDILERLIGMFAFAIWQPDRKSLFLARDRLGKKPLVYFEGPGFFAFASEMKALLALDEVRPRVDIDPLALSDFLSLGYIMTPRSILKGIAKLPAGHCGRYQGRQAGFRAVPYWRLEDFVTAPRGRYDGRAREEFAALLDDAVRLRLRSDVPVAGYLSGGIDSASVMALAARHGGASLKTFCVSFEDASFDESELAGQTAKHLGLDLTKLPCPNLQDDELEHLGDAFDEPFADTSQIPTYLMNRAASRLTKVALTGDGADECLAGYSTYRADVLHRLVSGFPSAVLRVADGLASSLLRPSYRKVSFDYKLRRFLGGAGLDRRRAHYWWRGLFSEDEKGRILSPDIVKACAGYDPFEIYAGYFAPVRSAAFLDQCLFVDIKTWLQDDILVKADRMSMANSVEVRSPFLDHRLVEFLAGLEPPAKMLGLSQKRILRHAMQGRLPASVLRRPKQGFNAPSRPYGLNAASARDFPQFFRHDLVLDPGAEDVSFKSFALRVLDIWLRKHARDRDHRREAWEPLR